MFRTAPKVAPARYYYTGTPAMVDPEGRTVSLSAIRPDMPATIYYTKVGDRVTGAQGRVEPTTRGLQARGNDYYDNDKTLTERSFPLKSKAPARNFAGALLYARCCLRRMGGR